MMLIKPLLFNIKLTLLALFFIFCSSYSTKAQVSAVKELKKDTQALNENKIPVSDKDPWSVNNIITADELSRELADSKTEKPLIYYAGFDFLYRQGHIPGAVYAGPGSRKEGLDKLKDSVQSVKHEQYIVIYCGCCPWKDCPNIRGTYKTLKDLGFTNVKVLYIPFDFAKDWKSKGYPVVK